MGLLLHKNSFVLSLEEGPAPVVALVEIPGVPHVQLFDKPGESLLYPRAHEEVVVIGHEAKSMEISQEEPRAALRGMTFKIIGRGKKSGGGVHPYLVVELEEVVYETEVISGVEKNLPLVNPSIDDVV